MTHKTKGKFQLKWEGPFVVESVYSNGAYRLITPEGDTVMMPIYGRFLKKYYQVNTTLLIKASRSKIFEERQRKASSFNGSHHGRSTLSRPNIINITMHNLNIEETKLETSGLTLSLFS